MDDSARLALRGNSGPGPGSSEVDAVIFIVDRGAAEKRPNPASDAGSNELPAWNEQEYSAFFCFILKNFQSHAYQFITDFTTTIVKPFRKRRLRRATFLWVALTWLPFRHHTQSLP